MCIIRIVEEKSKDFMPTKKLPIILEKKEVEKLLDQPSEKSLIGLRNKAIIKVMINCGLRVSEITKLEVSNIDLERGKLRVKQGKGGKDRDLFLPIDSLESLKDWEKKRPESVFFFSTLKGKKLCIRYLQEMIKRYSLKAGIKKRVSPHTLRHTFATEFYRQTKDIETLRKILGHANISTTTIYITLANIEVENAMKGFEGF